jgi:hypothetical protein
LTFCCIHLIGMNKKVTFETFLPRYPKLQKSQAQIITEKDEITQIKQERFWQQNRNRIIHAQELTEQYGQNYLKDRLDSKRAHVRNTLQRFQPLQPLEKKHYTQSSDCQKIMAGALISCTLVTTTIIIAYQLHTPKK